MTSKQEIDRLIDAGDAGALREKARDDAFAFRLVRRLMARLCSRDATTKWHAVSLLGVVAVEGAMPEDRVRDLLQRLCWALNDESGAVPFGVAEALGAVVAARPALRSVYAPLLVSYVVHDELVQTGPILAGAIWALGRVGIEDDEDRRRVLPGLRDALASADAELRGAALWTVGRLGLGRALREAVEARVDDDAVVTLLVDGEVRDLRSGDLARAALAASDAGAVVLA